MGKSKNLDYNTIRAAVSGQKWAVEKVLEYNADLINELATVTEKQPDGSVKKTINEDIRQQLILKLIEDIPNFPIDEPESEADDNGNKKS